MNPEQPSRMGRLLWALTLGLSLAGHGAVAAWMMQTPLGQQEGEEPQAEAIEIMLVAPEPEPAPLPESIAEPVEEPEPLVETEEPPELLAENVAEPETQPTPEMMPEPVAEESPVVDEPAPLPKPEPKPEPKKEPKREKKPEPKKEKTAEPKVEEKKKTKAPESQSASTPQKSQSASGGNKAWASQIRAKIEKRKRYPSAADGATGTVKLSISIAASGALAGVSVSASSGNAALDQAALDAVQRAAPFPASPEGKAAKFNLPIQFSRR
jgi:periplasmic protein TonB